MNSQNVTTDSTSDLPARETSGLAKSYQELPGLRHETKDVLKQLDSNILLLEDLTGRVGFMLTEIRSQVR